ncbi:MAG TPA: hypothetical protein VF006_08200 [Longimicrobium sp.]
MLFCQEFDNERGDVVYGLNSERTRYLVSWAESRVAQVEASNAAGDYGPYEQVEYRNDVESARRLPMRSKLMINDYNDPVARGDFSNPAQPGLYRTFDPDVRDYRDELVGHARYAPALVAAVGQAGLAKDDDRIGNGAQLTAQEQELAYRVHAIRRACKFGIEYITSLQGGAKIHYILDGIAMDEVVNKKARALWVGTVGVPITTSELRYLFRKWWRYKDTQRVIFYRDGMSTRAPWLEEPAKWLPYAHDRVEKHWQQGTINPGLAVEFTRHYLGNRPGPALHTFFRMTFPD